MIPFHLFDGRTANAAAPPADATMPSTHLAHRIFVDPAAIVAVVESTKADIGGTPHDVATLIPMAGPAFEVWDSPRRAAVRIASAKGAQ